MIGMNIQSRPKMCGLTQEQLAECLGVCSSQNCWRSGESGETSARSIERRRPGGCSRMFALDALIRYDSHRRVASRAPPRGKHLFGTVTVGERGQIVIPKQARDTFGIEPGDSLLVFGDEAQGIAITKAEDFIDRVSALLRAIGGKTVTARLPSWVLHAVARKEMPCGKLRREKEGRHDHWNRGCARRRGSGGGRSPVRRKATNRHGEARMIEKAHGAGFVEKQVDVGGAVVNCAEGPAGGPALLLIHGQCDAVGGAVASVLPRLAERYHAYAVDCFGHGESTRDPSLYTCAAQGEALVFFRRPGDRMPPTRPAGLSSGGIVAAWAAANDAERVTSLVLEDPPLFHVTPEEVQREPRCFRVAGRARDHARVSAAKRSGRSCRVLRAEQLSVRAIQEDLQPRIAEWTAAERAADPNEHLVLSWVPHDWVRGM